MAHAQKSTHLLIRQALPLDALCCRVQDQTQIVACVALLAGRPAPQLLWGDPRHVLQGQGQSQGQGRWQECSAVEVRRHEVRRHMAWTHARCARQHRCSTLSGSDCFRACVLVSTLVIKSWGDRLDRILQMDSAGFPSSLPDLQREQQRADPGRRAEVSLLNCLLQQGCDVGSMLGWCLGMGRAAA